MRAREIFEDVQSGLLQQVEQASKVLWTWGFDDVPDEARQFYGTDDREEVVKIVYAELLKTFRGGTATVYRVINAPDSVIADLRRGMTIGPHDMPNKPASWTLAPEELVMHAIEGERLHGNLQNYFVFVAKVPLSLVDIPVTIAQNIHVHWEQEVALKRGKIIYLNGIFRFDEHAGIRARVRPDLAGAMMKS